MTNYLIAMVSILFLLTAWLAMQALSRRFAEKHPELGTYREEGQGCGKSCTCTKKCVASKHKDFSFK